MRMMSRCVGSRRRRSSSSSWWIGILARAKESFGMDLGLVRISVSVVLFGGVRGVLFAMYYGNTTESRIAGSGQSAVVIFC